MRLVWNLFLLQATNEREIDRSVRGTVAQQRAAALFVAGDAFLGSRADQIVKLAARYAVPTSFALREQMAAGGLMSYGASLTETVRQAGNMPGVFSRVRRPVICLSSSRPSLSSSSI